MAETVADIMNPTLLYVREGDRMTLVRSTILRYGVTGVPVLDADHRPVGFVSLRDLPMKGDEPVHVSAPVVTVRTEEPVRDAARKLAATDLHHAVVVDGTGVAVGMVATVDFLRALTDLPPRRPARFEEPLPPTSR